MRKELPIIIAEEGRDQGKHFLITEMAASKAEKWAMRALLAVGRAGVDIGKAQGLGMQGIAILGVEAIFKLSFEDAEPLLDEMMTCVQYVSPENSLIKRPLVENDIEEITTRLKLRQDIIELHIGFFSSGKTSIFPSRTNSSSEPSNLQNTEMHPLSHGPPLSQQSPHQ